MANRRGVRAASTFVLLYHRYLQCHNVRYTPGGGDAARAAATRTAYHQKTAHYGSQEGFPPKPVHEPQRPNGAATPVSTPRGSEEVKETLKRKSRTLTLRRLVKTLSRARLFCICVKSS